MNCKDPSDDVHVWFLVNKLLNIYDPESIRQYNSYIETDGKVLEGAELTRLVKDPELLKKILSYERLK